MYRREPQKLEIKADVGTYIVPTVASLPQLAFSAVVVAKDAVGDEGWCMGWEPNELRVEKCYREELVIRVLLFLDFFFF